MSSTRLRFAPFILSTLCILLLSAWSQEKKSLDHDAYEIWNIVKERYISHDGNYTMYTYGPEDQDATLAIHKGDATPPFHERPRGYKATFSPDSRFAVYHVKPGKEEVRSAKLDGKKKDGLPKDSLEIIDLQNSATGIYANIKSFKLPKESGDWIAILFQKEKKEKAPGDKKSKPAEKAASPAPKKKKSKKKKAEGTDLLIRKLDGSREFRYNDVVSYTVADNGGIIAFTTANKDSSADGVWCFDTRTAELTELMKSPGDYAQIGVDAAGKQVAFLSNQEDFKAKQPVFNLYHWQTGQEAAASKIAVTQPALPTGWWLSEYHKLTFSEDGKRLFFGTAPRPEPEPDEEVLDEEKINVDIWHWKDPLLQPMQLKQLKDEKKRSYLAVYHIKEKKTLQLATEAIPNVNIANDGQAKLGLGTSTLPYRQEISWEWPSYRDVYVIDISNGKARKVISKLQSTAYLSPNGRYLAWWDRESRSWFAQSTKDGSKPVNISGKVPHRLDNEIHDWPYSPNSYGRAGWTKGDKEFLVYDKHDMWALDPSGRKAPRNMTTGVGRNNDLRMRYVRLDPEEEFIDTNKPALLSAVHYSNKGAGFYRTDWKSGSQPQQLTLEDKRFSTPIKAKNADQLLFTRSDVKEFPDLWVSAKDLSNRKKITALNPQQSDYKWATAEKFSWYSVDGQKLDGILYKPEDFDPANQYPMVVYFYEKTSQNLHRYYTLQPHRSVINPVFYASRGYIVFVPDIPYKIGYPGESAMNAVMPGVTELLKTGYVDPENVGVQGHSWGGYQIAYMVTRTNLFKAAAGGAPVSNMISAYGGIRWRTGRSRMFQYEQTQSRIGGSLWEKPLRYIENSPIFWVDKIETPLLIMHNDHDGAVPWYQGIELFVAMRRLAKPAWLINYNDELHWPTKYHKKRDWQIRLAQFFDHYLKGAPAPKWLDQGIPALEKETELGLEPITGE